MINEFLWPESEDINVDDVYFQQDGTTCHTSVETIGLLLEKFPGRVIGRRDHAIQHFNEKIRAVIDEIEPQMCENVISNSIKRTCSCKQSRGGHMNEIVFNY